MTHEEILRAQFEAVRTRAGWPRAMALWDDAVVLIAGEGMLSPGVYYGKEAVGRWFADWFGEFDDVVFELREVRQGSDALAAHALHRARGRVSGVEASLDLYYAYWFRNGKAIRAEIHQDRESAWRAAGVAG